MDNTCCFDSSWFWSTVGIILFMVFLGMGVSAYGWYQKKYHRSAAGNASVLSMSTASNGIAPALAAPGPRPAAQLTLSSLVCPKPPAYTSVSPAPTPQPGVTVGPQVVCRDDPPPYSARTGGVAAADSENSKSVCTQTSAV